MRGTRQDELAVRESKVLAAVSELTGQETTRAQFIRGAGAAALAALLSGCVARFRTPLPGNRGPSGGTWVKDPSPKNMVICFDGTWNRPGEKDEGAPVTTNVGTFYSTVSNALAYYAPGVGTHPLDRFWGGPYGLGLAQKVKKAYAFLAHHHEPGDRIFLVGFSRGAFAARSLGGMISFCGIVPLERLKEEPGLMEQAWDAYRYRKYNREEAARFKQASWASTIEMIGVWDTVEALGLPSVENTEEDFYGYHDVMFTGGFGHAYHALAIDEHRANFKPVPWPDGQGIEQVWFAGAHSDVGGGYADHGLADIALLWMIENAERHGLRFDAKSVCKSLRPDPGATLHDSYKGIYTQRDRWNRKIERGSLIHHSVVARLARFSDYRPVSLAGWAPGTNDTPSSYRIAEVGGSPALCL